MFQKYENNFVRETLSKLIEKQGKDLIPEIDKDAFDMYSRLIKIDKKFAIKSMHENNHRINIYEFFMTEIIYELWCLKYSDSVDELNSLQPDEIGKGALQKIGFLPFVDFLFGEVKDEYVRKRNLDVSEPGQDKFFEETQKIIDDAKSQKYTIAVKNAFLLANEKTNFKPKGYFKNKDNSKVYANRFKQFGQREAKKKIKKKLTG